jgi:hypothetical protein
MTGLHVVGLDSARQRSDSKPVVESEPPEAASATDGPADDEPRAVITTVAVGYYLWVAGLAGVTLTSLVSSAVLFWLSIAVFALGGVLQGVVAMWRWQNQATSREPDHERLGP